jgi:hypothetical protein
MLLVTWFGYSDHGSNSGPFEVRTRFSPLKTRLVCTCLNTTYPCIQNRQQRQRQKRKVTTWVESEVERQKSLLTTSLKPFCSFRKDRWQGLNTLESGNQIFKSSSKAPIFKYQMVNIGVYRGGGGRSIDPWNLENIKPWKTLNTITV